MQLNSAISAVWSKLSAWAQSFFDMLPNLAVAIVVVLAFSILSRWIGALAERVLGKTRLTTTARHLIGRLIQLSIFMAGVTIALSVLKLDKAVTSLLAGVGIVGLALGFAFQDLAANFVSGIALSIGSRYPFQVGDLIETNGVMGIAEQTFLRNSVIRTLDGDAVILPNKTLFENKLVNYSGDPYRRVQVSCGISYGDDLRKVKAVVLEALSGMEGLLKGRPVELFWSGYGDSSINFDAYFWIPFRRQTDFLEARSEAIMRIKEAFDRSGITIPFPIRTLDFGIKGGARLDELSPIKLSKTAANTQPAS